ncbi:hypothetical protein HID58_051086 [Brassica napus]|uniref:Transmembrane protein n=1 Tax=Brassica napus TaxID=3708 RepID=A0ABQ8A7Y7_BRANA|nr:hypothetical protein HID58_051086 [Brassica napus]
MKQCFFAISPYFELEPYCLCISLHFWCAVFLTITGKRLTFFSRSSSHSPPMRLYDRVYEFSVVRLILTAFLFVFDFVFLVVGLPSIVSARFGFQDLFFGVLTSMLSFIARGRFNSFLISLCLPFPIYSRTSLQLSSHLWWLSLSPCLPLEVCGSFVVFHLHGRLLFALVL